MIYVGSIYRCPMALAAQAPLLPHVQNQADRIASATVNTEKLRVKVGHANGVKIEMLEIPILECKDHCLRDGPRQDRKWRLECQSDEPQASGGVVA